MKVRPQCHFGNFQGMPMNNSFFQKNELLHTRLHLLKQVFVCWRLRLSWRLYHNKWVLASCVTVKRLCPTFNFQRTTFVIPKYPWAHQDRETLITWNNYLPLNAELGIFNFIYNSYTAAASIPVQFSIMASGVQKKTQEHINCLAIELNMIDRLNFLWISRN